MSADLRSELFGDGMTGSSDWYGSDYNNDGNGSVNMSMPMSNAQGSSYFQQEPQQQNSYTSYGFDAPTPDELSGGISGVDDDDYVEPPLLEELGINFAHIWTKTAAVMLPTRKIDPDILDDSDLAGPIVFFLIQGFCLLLVSTPHVQVRLTLGF